MSHLPVVFSSTVGRVAGVAALAAVLFAVGGVVATGDTVEPPEVTAADGTTLEEVPAASEGAGSPLTEDSTVTGDAGEAEPAEQAADAAPMVEPMEDVVEPEGQDPETGGTEQTPAEGSDDTSDQAPAVGDSEAPAAPQDAPAVVVDPAISADQEFYAPSDVAVLEGSGWAPGESVEIRLTNVDYSYSQKVVTLTVPDDGKFVVKVPLPTVFVVDLSITASGESGRRVVDINTLEGSL